MTAPPCGDDVAPPCGEYSGVLVCDAFDFDEDDLGRLELADDDFTGFILVSNSKAESEKRLCRVDEAFGNPK